MIQASDLVTETGNPSLVAAIEDFAPRRWLRNGHLQTLVGNFWPRQYGLPDAETRVIQVDRAHAPVSPAGAPFASPLASGSQQERAEAAAHAFGASHVICHCNWQAHAASCPTVVLLHGLEGSSRSQYMLGNAAGAWAAGCNVVRMNMRNCGGTENMSPTLYHSGLSEDVAAVMRALVEEKDLAAFVLVGYSMGGNVVLKLAGDLGTDAPRYLKAVVGISPAMDLAASADALHDPANRVYEWKFLRGLKRRFRRKAELFPAIYSTAPLKTVTTLRQFDDRVTARYSGFAGADDYYARAASSRVASNIAIPTLVVHALDDPFVRMLPQTRHDLVTNPAVDLVETAHGGHCAFLAPAVAYDGYWAEKRLLRFLLLVAG